MCTIHNEGDKFFQEILVFFYSKIGFHCRLTIFFLVDSLLTKLDIVFEVPGIGVW